MKVSVFFGNGCFWSRQHAFVAFERQLGRTDDQLTSIAAYAGNATPGTLCYEEYGKSGAAEVVALDVDNVTAAALTYFDSFVPFGSVYERDDYYDLGPDYRALVGVPGGLDGAYGAQLTAANIHNMTLVQGNGSDPDTLGTNSVYVLDSDLFPYTQAELCMQFHDDQNAPPYPASYHNLTAALLASGRLQPTACPPNDVCAY